MLVKTVQVQETIKIDETSRKKNSMLFKTVQIGEKFKNSKQLKQLKFTMQVLRKGL